MSSPGDSNLNQPRLLRIGPFSALLLDGDLRYLTIGQVEVLRRIFVSARDDAWGTIPGQVLAMEWEESDHAARIVLGVSHRAGKIAFTWTGTMEARVSHADGRSVVHVRFEIAGNAETSFLTNRTGLCVLHPLCGVAGQPCTIEHDASLAEQTAFPRLVAPASPFTDIRAIRHEPAPGVHVEIRFQGEVFETEDQRNWADGSFKTYGRPLSLPIPYPLQAGAAVQHVVELHITAEDTELGAAPASVPVPVNEMTAPRRVGRLPRIGLRLPELDWRPNPFQKESLTRLNLSHVRVDIRTGDLERGDVLAARLACAASLGLDLEVGLHCDGEASAGLEDLARGVLASGGRVVRWLVYSTRNPVTPDSLWRKAAKLLHGLAPAIPVGGGTAGNFAQLNHERPGLPVEALAYAVCPQVHSRDDLSIVECLEGLTDPVATAQSFAPKAWLAVGPVQFHRRPDPFAKGKSGEEREPELPDPRQRTAFCAAWTLGAVAGWTECRADSVTLYDAWGPFGVMDDAALYPAWHVLHALGQLSGAEVLATERNAPPRVVAMTFRQDGQTLVLAANLTNRAQPLGLVVPPSAERRRIAHGDPDRSADSSGAEHAGTGEAQHVLTPHEVVSWSGKERQS